MKETLAAIAVTLSLFVSFGQLDPNMTIGQFIEMYRPQEVVIEQTAMEPMPEAASMNNEMPKEELAIPELPEIVIEDPVVPEVTLTVEQPVVPVVKAYTGADAKGLASIVGIEARGLDVKQKRAVVRCALNRVDDWGLSIQEVIESGAFYRTNSYTEEDLALANEELYNWSINGPRSLPEGYYYFNGDGEQNYFRKTLSGERLSLL